MPSCTRRSTSRRRYHLTMNMFYHPVYIANYPACRAAIEEALRYIKSRNIRALHFGNDQLYAGGRQGRTRVEPSDRGRQHVLEFDVESDSAAGVVVKIGLGRLAAQSVTLDGVAQPSCLVAEQRFGQNWALVVAPRGKTRVTLQLQQP